MRSPVLSLGLAVALAATCAAVASAAASQDRDAIERLFLERFVEAWQAGDAAGLARLWHEDGDWMSLVGSRRVFTGRDQIEGVWAVGLQGRETPEQRRLEIEIDALRQLGPDLALVDLVMTFGTARIGVVREAMTALLEKGSAGWLIVSCRVARISASDPD